MQAQADCLDGLEDCSFTGVSPCKQQLCLIDDDGDDDEEFPMDPGSA